MSITTQLLFLYSVHSAVVTAASLLLEIKFWPEMKMKEKRTKTTAKQQQSRKQKNKIKFDNIKVVQIF